MKNHFLIILMMISFLSSAQDTHYSLYYASPLSLNPALCGVPDFPYPTENIRVTANYRQQWRSIKSNYLTKKTPFLSSTFGTEWRLNIDKTRKLGIGFQGAFDKSGDLGLYSRQASITTNFIQYFNHSSRNLLSVAFQAGYGTKGLNIDNGVFDSQWTGTAYDPSLPTNEQVQNYNYNFADFSTGLLYQNAQNSSFKYNFGASYMHFNNPKELNINSYSLFKTIILSKLTLHSQIEYLPEFQKSYIFYGAMHRQGPATELFILGFVNFYTTMDRTSFYRLGGGYRSVGNYTKLLSNDAIALSFAGSFDKISIGLSYDFNVSGLRKTTSGFGAFELSLIYHGFWSKNKKGKNFKFMNKIMDCPEERNYKTNIRK